MLLQPVLVYFTDALETDNILFTRNLFLLSLN